MSNTPTEILSSDAPLMDIHEAARFLRVSEVSIRRYTNSGALACLRIGGRRERRFRREDLHAFLGSKQPTQKPADEQPHASNSAKHNCANIEGVDVPWGSHLCQLYETDRGRVQMAAPFLADGLDAGHACFLIASETTRTLVIDAAKRHRSNIADDIQAGRLQLIDCAKSGPEMLATLDNAFGEAMEKGFPKLRLVGDMAWFLDQGHSSDDLVSFETRYDLQIGHSYPIVSLCLYDARRFSGVEILHTLRSHTDTFQLPLSRFLLR
jgi:excisionase family DNA binding protein